MFPRLRAPDLLTAHARDAALDIFTACSSHDPSTNKEDGITWTHSSRRLTLRDVAVELAASDEFHRCAAAHHGRFHDPRRAPDGFVDVRELIKDHTLEELLGAAEEYYGGRETRPIATMRSRSPTSRRPICLDRSPISSAECASLEGSCARFRGGRGLDHSCSDAARVRSHVDGCVPTALALGKELFDVCRWWHLRGAAIPALRRPPDRYLPSESIDRVMCFDALHHVPNPARSAVRDRTSTRPGGVAAFRSLVEPIESGAFAV